MTTTTAILTPVFSVKHDTKVVQVMSDIWENWSYTEIKTIKNGEFISTCLDRDESIAVNATEADIALAKELIAKQAYKFAEGAVSRFSYGDEVLDLPVEVISGRKVKKGSKGIIRKAGSGAYGRWYFVQWSDKTEGFVSASNCIIQSGVNFFGIAETIARENIAEYQDKLSSDFTFAYCVECAIRDEVRLVAKANRHWAK